MTYTGNSAIVIIGAARSGTNILRDVVCGTDGVGTWPCDEIPLIWRFGNRSLPHDEFERSDAHPRAMRYIRARFRDRVLRDGLDRVVEKTCANSLRVGFVDEVLPGARFVHIVRDGRDVVASAMKRWRSRFDLAYSLRKARFVPPVDAPYYAWKTLRNRIHQRLSGTGRLATWGPRIRDLPRMARDLGLAEVCAHQWARCVERSNVQLAELDDDRVHRLRYEDFVAEPEAELERLFTFLDLPTRGTGPITATVRADSVGKGRRDLDADQLDRIDHIIRPVLRRHGYA